MNWTSAEKRTLILLHDGGMFLRDIGRILGRTKGSCVGQYWRMERSGEADIVRGITPEPEPEPEVQPETSANACRTQGCRLTPQPGRDICAMCNAEILSNQGRNRANMKSVYADRGWE